MDNKELIAIVKGIIDTNVGGLVTTKQLDKFITTIVDKSGFLKRGRVERNIATTLQLDRLGIDSRVLRKKVEAVAPTTPTGVTREYEVLTPSKVILYSQLSYDWLQKALGGTPNLNPDSANAVENLVYDLLAKQFANDLVDLGFNGDTTQTGDDFLKIMHGWLKKFSLNASCHNDTYAGSDVLTDIFDAMYEAMPTEFKIDSSKLKYLVNPKTATAYRRLLGERNTALGDLMMVKNEPLYYNGILIDPIWAMPEDHIVLSFDENFAIGFGQNMLVERDKDIKAQTIDLVVTADIAYNCVIPEAVVYYTKSYRQLSE